MNQLFYLKNYFYSRSRPFNFLCYIINDSKLIYSILMSNSRLNFCIDIYFSKYFCQSCMAVLLAVIVLFSSSIVTCLELIITSAKYCFWIIIYQFITIANHPLHLYSFHLHSCLLHWSANFFFYQYSIGIRYMFFENCHFSFQISPQLCFCYGLSYLDYFYLLRRDPFISFTASYKTEIEICLSCFPFQLWIILKMYILSFLSNIIFEFF